MPTPTEPTPAEIAALERRIAEGVMDAEQMDGCWYRFPDGSQRSVALPYPSHATNFAPWHNPADALEVLERLMHLNPPELIAEWYTIERNGMAFTVNIRYIPGAEATAHGPHFGPAVCFLAKQILNHNKEG